MNYNYYVHTTSYKSDAVINIKVADLNSWKKKLLKERHETSWLYMDRVTNHLVH
jgi:hypothetical protein